VVAPGRRRGAGALLDQRATGAVHGGTGRGVRTGVDGVGDTVAVVVGVAGVALAVAVLVGLIGVLRVESQEPSESESL
jgi:hypothetical protein